MKKIYIKRNELFEGISLILCNNITEADKNFIDDNFELFYTPCDDCKGTGNKDDEERCEECHGTGRFDNEPYQYFLCNINDWKKTQLSSYGVEVGYSELLDLHVLPIYDYGTSWTMFNYSKEVEDDYKLAYNETLTRSTDY